MQTRWKLKTLEGWNLYNMKIQENMKQRITAGQEPQQQYKEIERIIKSTFKETNGKVTIRIDKPKKDNQ